MDFIHIENDKAIYSNTWSVLGIQSKWNMVHYDEQLLAGIFLHYGYAIEMATGEGKTLVVTLPAIINALSHEGVHVVTVNSYLSKRDFELTRPIYSFFVLTSGCVEYWQTHDNKRKGAYGADITFGTSSAFVFDYLCDHMVLQSSDIVQRGHNYAIIDEMDSLLVDDAVNPHIIGGESFDEGKNYNLWKLAIEELLKDNSLYKVDFVNHRAEFTEKGYKWLKCRSEIQKQNQFIEFENVQKTFNYWQNVWQQLATTLPGLIRLFTQCSFYSSLLRREGG